MSRTRMKKHVVSRKITHDARNFRTYFAAIFSIFATAMLFTVSTAYAADTGWIGGDGPGVSSGTGEGGNGGGCNADKDKYQIDCAGTSWIYFKFNDAEEQALAGKVMEVPPEVNSTEYYKIPGNCARKGGGFWHYGWNNMGLEQDGFKGYFMDHHPDSFENYFLDTAGNKDFLYKGYPGSWGHAKTIGYGTITDPQQGPHKVPGQTTVSGAFTFHANEVYQDIYLKYGSGHKLMYKADHMGTDSEVLEAYKQAAKALNGSSPTSIAKGTWGFCWWPGMENTDKSVQFASKSGAQTDKWRWSGYDETKTVDKAVEAESDDTEVSLTFQHRLFFQESNAKVSKYFTNQKLTYTIEQTVDGAVTDTIANQQKLELTDEKFNKQTDDKKYYSALTQSATTIAFPIGKEKMTVCQKITYKPKSFKMLIESESEKVVEGPTANGDSGTSSICVDIVRKKPDTKTYTVTSRTGIQYVDFNSGEMEYSDFDDEIDGGTYKLPADANEVVVSFDQQLFFDFGSNRDIDSKAKFNAFRPILNTGYHIDGEIDNGIDISTDPISVPSLNYSTENTSAGRYTEGDENMYYVNRQTIVKAQFGSENTLTICQEIKYAIKSFAVTGDNVTTKNATSSDGSKACITFEREEPKTKEREFMSKSRVSANGVGSDWSKEDDSIEVNGGVEVSTDEVDVVFKHRLFYKKKNEDPATAFSGFTFESGKDQVNYSITTDLQTPGAETVGGDNDISGEHLAFSDFNKFSSASERYYREFTLTKKVKFPDSGDSFRICQTISYNPKSVELITAGSTKTATVSGNEDSEACVVVKRIDDKIDNYTFTSKSGVQYEAYNSGNMTYSEFDSTIHAKPDGADAYVLESTDPDPVVQFSQRLHARVPLSSDINTIAKFEALVDPPIKTTYSIAASGTLPRSLSLSNLVYSSNGGNQNISSITMSEDAEYRYFYIEYNTGNITLTVPESDGGTQISRFCQQIDYSPKNVTVKNGKIEEETGSGGSGACISFARKAPDKVDVSEYEFYSTSGVAHDGQLLTYSDKDKEVHVTDVDIPASAAEIKINFDQRIYVVKTLLDQDGNPIYLNGELQQVRTIAQNIEPPISTNYTIATSNGVTPIPADTSGTVSTKSGFQTDVTGGTYYNSRTSDVTISLQGSNANMTSFTVCQEINYTHKKIRVTTTNGTSEIKGEGSGGSKACISFKRQVPPVVVPPSECASNIGVGGIDRGNTYGWVEVTKKTSDGKTVSDDTKGDAADDDKPAVIWARPGDDIQFGHTLCYGAQAVRGSDAFISTGTTRSSLKGLRKNDFSIKALFQVSTKGMPTSTNELEANTAYAFPAYDEATVDNAGRKGVIGLGETLMLELGGNGRYPSNESLPVSQSQAILNLDGGEQRRVKQISGYSFNVLSPAEINNAFECPGATDSASGAGLYFDLSKHDQDFYQINSAAPLVNTSVAWTRKCERQYDGRDYGSIHDVGRTIAQSISYTNVLNWIKDAHFGVKDKTFWCKCNPRNGYQADTAPWKNEYLSQDENQYIDLFGNDHKDDGIGTEVGDWDKDRDDTNNPAGSNSALFGHETTASSTASIYNVSPVRYEDYDRSVTFGTVDRKISGGEIDYECRQAGTCNDTWTENVALKSEEDDYVRTQYYMSESNGPAPKTTVDYSATENYSYTSGGSSTTGSTTYYKYDCSAHNGGIHQTTNSSGYKCPDDTTVTYYGSTTWYTHTCPGLSGWELIDMRDRFGNVIAEGSQNTASSLTCNYRQFTGYSCNSDPTYAGNSHRIGSTCYYDYYQCDANYPYYNDGSTKQSRERYPGTCYRKVYTCQDYGGDPTFGPGVPSSATASTGGTEYNTITPNRCVRHVCPSGSTRNIKNTNRNENDPEACSFCKGSVQGNGSWSFGTEYPTTLPTLKLPNAFDTVDPINGAKTGGGCEFKVNIRPNYTVSHDQSEYPATNNKDYEDEGGKYTDADEVYTKTAVVRIPYNYYLTVGAEIKEDTTMAYLGEDIEYDFNIAVNPRVNLKVDTTTPYATYTRTAADGGTKIQAIQFVISPEHKVNFTGKMENQGYNDMCRYFKNDQDAPATDCKEISIRNVDDALNADGNPATDGKPIKVYDEKDKKITVPDDPSVVEIGSLFCIAVGVYPADSHGEPGVKEVDGMSDFSQAKWAISSPSCRTVGKKPNFQVWNGGVYTEGKIETSAIRKAIGWQLNANPATNFTSIRSWGEYLVTAGQNIVNFGSGAVTGYGDTFNPATSASNYTTQTISNTGAPGYSGISGVSPDDMINKLLSRFASTSSTSSSWKDFPEGQSYSKYMLLSGPQEFTDNLVLNDGVRVLIVDGELTIKKNICVGDTGTGENACQKSTVEQPQQNQQGQQNQQAEAKPLKLEERNDQKYTDLTSFPQVIIIADNIKIAPEVTQIDAWLIASNVRSSGNTFVVESYGNIDTCSVDVLEESQAINVNGENVKIDPYQFKEGSNIIYRYDDLNDEQQKKYDKIIDARKLSTKCENTLMINGPVIANKLMLNRTAGAEAGVPKIDAEKAKNLAEQDLSDNGSATPAEIFNLRPDVYLWAYSQLNRYTQVKTTYSRELSPRY